MLSRRFPHSISSAGGSMAPPDDIDDGDYEPNDEDELMDEPVCHHDLPLDVHCYDCEEEHIDTHDEDFPEEAA